MAQTFIFEKSKYSLPAAKAWLKRNGYKAGKVDEKEKTYRFRQRDPSAFEKGTIRTKTLAPGIKMTVGRLMSGSKVMEMSNDQLLLAHTQCHAKNKKKAHNEIVLEMQRRKMKHKRFSKLDDGCWVN